MARHYIQKIDMTDSQYSMIDLKINGRSVSENNTPQTDAAGLAGYQIRVPEGVNDKPMPNMNDLYKQFYNDPDLMALTMAYAKGLPKTTEQAKTDLEYLELSLVIGACNNWFVHAPGKYRNMLETTGAPAGGWQAATSIDQSRVKIREPEKTITWEEYQARFANCGVPFKEGKTESYYNSRLIGFVYDQENKRDALNASVGIKIAGGLLEAGASSIGDYPVGLAGKGVKSGINYAWQAGNRYAPSLLRQSLAAFGRMTPGTYQAAKNVSSDIFVSTATAVQAAGKKFGAVELGKDILNIGFDVASSKLIKDWFTDTESNASDWAAAFVARSFMHGMGKANDYVRLTDFDLDYTPWADALEAMLEAALKMPFSAVGENTR